MQTHWLSSTSSDVDRTAHLATPFGRAFVAILLLALAACEKAQPTIDTDSIVDTTVAPPFNPGSDSAAIVASGWESDAGPFIVLPTVDGGLTSGSLLRPGVEGERLGDTTGLSAIAQRRGVELFSRAGKVGQGQLSVEVSRRIDPQCAAWPTARLRFDGGAAAPNWTAAFEIGRITPIPLDSIEGMAPRDSAGLAAELARLASALPNDTVATFQGLPFVVLRAYRASEEDASFVIATLIRRVGQEDSPREERLVMVIDAPGENARRWHVAWFERASGTEDELIVAEPLLAFRALGATDIRLLFGRDDGVSLSAALLSRGASGWVLQWESPATGCDF